VKEIEMKWYSFHECMPPMDDNVMLAYVADGETWYSFGALEAHPDNILGLYTFYHISDEVKPLIKAVTHWAKIPEELKITYE